MKQTITDGYWGFCIPIHTRYPLWATRAAIPAHALYGGIRNKQDWTCNPAIRNAWHGASNDNLAADDATSGNGTSPNCSIPDKWRRLSFYRKRPINDRGIIYPSGKTGIIHRSDRGRQVKIGVMIRSRRDLLRVWVCRSFPAYRLKVYVQGYARYLDCRARLTTARYN